MRISDWSSDVCSSDLLAHKAMEEAADKTALEYGLAWVRPTLGNYVSHDLIEGLGRLPCEPAPMTEQEAQELGELEADRKSVVKGKSVSVSVDLGGRRILKKNTHNTNISRISHH